MEQFRAWISTVISSALSQALATFFAGVIITALAFLFAGGLTDFLQAQVNVPVSLLLILIALSLIGISVAADRIYDHLQQESKASSTITRDPRLEATQSALLESLAFVESRPELYGQDEAVNFRTKLISQFDAWEIAVQDYVTPEHIEEIKATRDHIQERNLSHSGDEAKQWVDTVKRISNIARQNMR